jgi:hypothetical protein
LELPMTAPSVQDQNHCQEVTICICESRWIFTMHQIIINDMFRSKQVFPPCPSPTFLGSHNTYCSTHHIPIVSKPIANAESYIPMWKIWYKPWIELEPGLFVQGRFGQGVILELSHKDRKFHYFICHTFNNGPVFLVVRNRWQQSWWGNFLSRYNVLWSCIQL